MIKFEYYPLEPYLSKDKKEPKIDCNNCIYCENCKDYDFCNLNENIL